MQLKRDLFINGQWVKGSGLLPVMNPSTGALIADVATADESLCDAAITH